MALGADEVAELHRRTEGWPAGLYLAALYLREGGSLRAAAVSFGGDDRLVSEYVESEFLARISRAAAGVPDPDRGAGADVRAAVRGGAGATRFRRDPGRPGPVEPAAGAAGPAGKWYRYHHLFRDMLLAELDRLEPGLIPVLRRRAAGWYLRNGLPEEALEYSMAAGDVDAAARLVERLGVPAYRQGRVTTLQRWFGWLEDRGGIEGHPMAAVRAAFLAAMTGRPAEAERWADVVDRWQYRDAARPADPAAEAWAAVLRAMLCRRGVEQMRADADEAARRFAAEGIVAPVAALCQGSHGSFPVTPTAATRPSRPRSAVGRKSARPRPSRSRWASGRCWRWHAVTGAGPRPWPSRHAAVLRRAGIEDSYAMPLLCAAQARVALHRGDVPRGAPAARQRSAAAAPADLRAPPPGRSGPDRARSASISRSPTWPGPGR